MVRPVDVAAAVVSCTAGVVAGWVWAGRDRRRRARTHRALMEAAAAGATVVWLREPADGEAIA